MPFNSLRISSFKRSVALAIAIQVVGSTTDRSTSLVRFSPRY